VPVEIERLATIAVDCGFRTPYVRNVTCLVMPDLIRHPFSSSIQIAEEDGSRIKSGMTV